VALSSILHTHFSNRRESCFGIQTAFALLTTMSSSGSLTRCGAIRRRRWSASDGDLPHVSITSANSAGGSSGSSSVTQSRPHLSRSSVTAVRVDVAISAGYVSHFPEDTDIIEPGSPHSMLRTPFEFLPGPTSPIPGSPVPSYHSMVLYNAEAAHNSVVPVGGLSRASTTSVSSLPDYDKIEQGPPTGYLGYSNFIIPGTEMQADEEEIWVGLEPSYWDTAPFVTDPAMPRCPGLADGSCPIHEAHNSGNYFWEQRTPSALLVVILAQHNVAHIFEGSCPPEAVWAALLSRLTGSENEASEDLLFGFRWWHCFDYRARVIARRQPRVDIRQSSIYVRRINRQSLQQGVRNTGEGDTEEDVLMADQIRALEISTIQEDGDAQQDDVYDLWDAYFDRDEEPSTTGVEGSGDHQTAYDSGDERMDSTFSDFDSVSVQYSDLVNDSSPRNEDEYVDSTYFFLPNNLPRESYYHRYGFTLPSEDPMIVPPASLPPYPPCLSSLCPIRFPHIQGPFWDSGPISIPMSLIPGPMSHLRAAPNLAAYLDTLSEQGLGDIFGSETSPPMFILAAVERIVDGNPQLGDLRTVEWFRYFHCRACRPIVMPDEETMVHEENVEEPPSPPSSQGSEVSDLEVDNTMDSDDWAQYFD